MSEKLTDVPTARTETNDSGRTKQSLDVPQEVLKKLNVKANVRAALSNIEEALGELHWLNEDLLGELPDLTSENNTLIETLESSVISLKTLRSDLINLRQSIKG
jgi:hypothetical protein